MGLGRWPSNKPEMRHLDEPGGWTSPGRAPTVRHDTSLGYRPRKRGIETIQGLKARYHPPDNPERAPYVGPSALGFHFHGNTQAGGLGFLSVRRWRGGKTGQVTTHHLSRLQLRGRTVNVHSTGIRKVWHLLPSAGQSSHCPGSAAAGPFPERFPRG